VPRGFLPRSDGPPPLRRPRCRRPDLPPVPGPPDRPGAQPARRGAAEKEDPEDVVQSVFKSFFGRHAAGQFEVESPDDLWSLLTVITLRKCGHRIDYFRAARRDVQREVALEAGTDEVPPGWEALARDPTPAEAAMLAETVERLLRNLEGADRRIFQLSLQGESVAQISSQVGLSERTVERVRREIRRCLERLRGGRGGEP
jgi:RNA polymerase sigma-70 factor (ECF subfamily)